MRVRKNLDINYCEDDLILYFKDVTVLRAKLGKKRK